PRRHHAPRPRASVRAHGSAPIPWGHGTGPVLLLPPGARVVELSHACPVTLSVRRGHPSRRRGERRSRVQRGPRAPRGLARAEGPLGGGTPPPESLDHPQRKCEEPLALRVCPPRDRLRGQKGVLQLNELFPRREERIDG